MALPGEVRLLALAASAALLLSISHLVNRGFSRRCEDVSGYLVCFVGLGKLERFRLVNGTVTPPPGERIVLTDNLKEWGVDAVRAVAAHEEGHLALRHLRLAVLASMASGALLGSSMHVMAISPLAAVLLPPGLAMLLMLYRSFEGEADWYAARREAGYRSFLAELHRRQPATWLGRLTHGGLERRLKAAEGPGPSAAGTLFPILYFPSAAVALTVLRGLPAEPAGLRLLMLLALPLSSWLLAAFLAYLVYRLLLALGFGLPEARLSTAAYFVLSALPLAAEVGPAPLVVSHIAAAAVAALLLADFRREKLPKAAAAWALVLAVQATAALAWIGLWRP